MSNSSLLELGQPAVMKNVGRLPVVFTRGEGSRLWDADGKEYLDLLTGISVHNFGHSHPAITEALVRQAGKIIHVSNYFYLEEQVKLAAALTKLTGFQQVFFSNSGAEANEAALKLARKYGKVHLDGKYQIVTARDSFHGRTFGALSATGQPKYQASFQPVVRGFVYAPMNDLDAWKTAIGDQSCAILIELVQGEGGVVPADPEFIAGLVAFCRERRVLVMVDEVQTGFGRTGKYFAYEHFHFRPDVITVAKTLGGGIPCGALLVDERANLFEPGDHSTTIGGGAMAFAAGLAVLDLLQEPGLMAEVIRKGRHIQDTWEEWRKELPVIKGSRGIGMMLALDLNIPSKPVMLKCLERGLVVNAVTDTAIRILPALNIPPAELDEALAIMKQVLREFS
ncbi:acetylornithine aminotransferase/acetylornithine/N-succinyldiaminopimelate aminotransferase [Hydrogenispora ethanolica]|jgi:predicted acetylornithine/succinylornithine family transaminase|uniref:Acetylornithine aminotransferase/acetylornithine/N-succinyldiaminopimelate aminotransferase n=1 Tax=Hydrogenispora ethanolica TaxID=1082276 RepID=A0A4R1RFR5_HYDET|nr:aspartate aminotransferase family protein [Hydrogenispora ethanolica]TCL64781.1 acetylornithine aminotransferase/acetylornithine/N-succinyldiaminopimelate aminotransferase [Hydrogenispora ethanolica]